MLWPTPYSTMKAPCCLRATIATSSAESPRASSKSETAAQRITRATTKRTYYINQEIEAGERQTAKASTRSAPQDRPIPSRAAASQLDQKEHRKRQKEIKNLEKKIARLDDEKREINQHLLATTDAAEAMKLHNQLTEVSDALNDVEERWLELTEDN